MTDSPTDHADKAELVAAQKHGAAQALREVAEQEAITIIDSHGNEEHVVLVSDLLAEAAQKEEEL